MQGFIHFRFTTAVVLFALVSHVVLAQQPFVSITSNDGTQYIFYRNESSITASVASAKCAAAGGTLASIISAEQVRDTLWSKPVVDAAEEDPSLLWTGIKITWPSTGSHRRMLRGSRTQHVADATRNGNEFPNSELETNVMAIEVDDVGMSLIELLAKQMDGSTDFLVPTHTGDGRRRLPELLRLWLYKQHLQAQQILTQTTQDSAATRLRNLLSRDGGSPYLDDAKLTWADGSDASFVLANPSNMGFLACNRKKVTECCGAVFDIGPGPYLGSEFPTIFFYPCGAEKVSGAMLPTGYLCAVTPQVAQLPKPSKSPSKAGPSPSGSSPRKCTPGTMPAARVGTLHPCTKCKPNTYSDDGTKCKKCPDGKTSERGAIVCS
ncbi:hypothetical protein Vretifemale_20517 [Volvox reticuliferus]|uniref:Uncharacterized protein n=1 Tax=Volvox reticuliferus TaxID=1737510 RepID=A0A8J4FXE7_9CHLO|nr:hypothetical protein Vretifemale_20517 [Volvox reticuliferus]